MDCLKAAFVPFRAFLAEVSSSLDSEAISSLNELAAVLHVLAVIKHSEFTGLFLFWLVKMNDSYIIILLSFFKNR